MRAVDLKQVMFSVFQILLVWGVTNKNSKAEAIDTDRRLQ